MPLAITFFGQVFPAPCAAAPGKVSGAAQQAEEALMPFLDVLANPPAGNARAFRVQGKLESLGTQAFPKEEASFDFALQPPARLRLTFPVNGVPVTACRDGQTGWVAPASVVRPLLAQIPSAKSKKQFPPMELPFSGRQLSLLPALLEVSDKGFAPLDGSPCRVLDVRIQPDLARLLPPETAGWALRLWLNAGGRPARAGIQGPDNSAVLRLDHIQFAPQFAADLWAAPADAIALTPAEFDALAALLLEGKSRKTGRN